MQMKEIPIKEIHEDFFFCFKTHLEDEKLRQSIQMAGIRTPLTVHKYENKYRIISGFRRCHAARVLGLDSIPVYQSDPNQLGAAFLQALSVHSVQWEITLIEKARILHILKSLGLSGETQWEQFFPLLDIPKKGRVADDIMRLLSFSSQVQNYIERHNLSLKQTAMFDSMDEETQEIFVSLAIRLEIRAVELGRIIELIRDIAGKECIPMDQVLGGKHLQTILNDKERTRDQKIALMKSKLNARRYPRLTEWNKALSTQRKQLALPPFAQLDWNPALESPGLTLRATLRSIEDVENLTNQLSKAAALEAFQSMFEVV